MACCAYCVTSDFPHERDIHNALLSGEGGMISAAPALAVERLSSLIRKHSLTRSFLSYSEGGHTRSAEKAIGRVSRDLGGIRTIHRSV